MGTPDFAEAILKNLVDKKYTVVGVITAADKPAGRGLKLQESAVKKYAKSQNIPTLQPKNLKNEEFLKALKALNADVQIVVAFRMLPKEVWQMPKFGTFNLHASLLPDYRGAAPIHWAIINGETKTGVTTFFIDDTIDTGEIILKNEVAIGDDEIVGTLHDKLMISGAQLVAQTVDCIEKGTVKTTKQPNSEQKEAPKLSPENTKIDWDESLEKVYNKIRGLNPFPAAWTTIQTNGEEISAKIYAVKKEEKSHSLLSGKILSTKKEFKVAVKNGFIHILEIKLAGKRLMDTKSLLNGFSFSKDSKML
ncbi:MAG: methionyl-tRNA formyltransferase [Flavobacteriia bacterium]|nr:methionyl-tRNA formyltransferase [Flavobacteriia bacterium]OIP45868.1 MAG: methionyl-tRNA formyltransferase [Flavobacteriaceae bacterium CG2_30_31_66]PIV96988.1 MAG: methionyl-tRNA formyltransferase [Flavobacteriaceae bacterium CG17_big_fil_post_rev_8_21_14_2_50_31_13]PIY15165.1 MAG: methionyl-tRNA formyltransferase [Flavobacteriaceae bacterium CG_4_10_14_3_um_filter_31_253]PIZ09491.1 MAG: methionyl-tRNA formyltransferase [Flavobacteriaceae bacterium CG_4_10_14_0_8_um_filter_31_99]PJC10050.